MPGFKEKVKYFPKVMFIITPFQLLQAFGQNLMLAVKAIFLTDELGYTENFAVMISHLFISLEAVAHLSGAVLADSIFGKWKLIVVGFFIMRVSDMFFMLAVIPGMPKNQLFLAGLCFGTFLNIHIPTLNAFLSEQFQLPEAERMLKWYYNSLYWGRNFVSIGGSYGGSRLADVGCFGMTTCFAAPISLWLVTEITLALVVVSLSRFFIKKPPSHSVILNFIICIIRAIRNRIKKPNGPRERWVDYADDKFDEAFRNDVYRFVNISYFFMLSILYWSLYDQMYSRFIYQTARLNSQLSDNVRLYPGDIILVNPALVIILLPLLEYGIYPLCRRIGILKTELQKVATSDYLIATAFIAAMALEMSIDYLDVKPPGKGKAELTIYNALSQDLQTKGTLIGDRIISAYGSAVIKNINVENSADAEFSNSADAEFFYSEVGSNKWGAGYVKLEERGRSSYLVNQRGLAEIKGSKQLKKDTRGNPMVRVVCAFKCYDLKFVATSGSTEFYMKGASVYQDTPFEAVKYGKYNVYKDDKMVMDPVKLDEGGVYTIIIYDLPSEGSKAANIFVNLPPSRVSFLWVLPQLFLITLGEIMHAIPWRLFIYTQSPPSMRSVVFAFDLLSRSLGDLIVAIVAGSSLMAQKYEFLLFAVLMYIVSIFFTIMAIKYKPQQSRE